VIFLVTPDADAAKVCRGELEKNLPQQGGPLLSLEPEVSTEPASLVTRLEGALHGPKAGLCWIELPEEVPYEAIPDAQAAWDRAFAALNPHRNRILQELPGPLIFAGPPWMFQSFRSHAPDWFSVRAGVFDLTRDIEQALSADRPQHSHDRAPKEPIPDVEIPVPEFPPDVVLPTAEVLGKTLADLPVPQIAVLQTLSWLDPAHPVPLWLLASHPALPDGADVLETLDALVRHGFLNRSTDGRALRLYPAVMAAVAQSFPNESARRNSLGNAFQMMHDANLGNPMDVRTWLKWNPLQPHAVSICNHAPDDPAPQHLAWLLSQLGKVFHTKGLHAEAEKYSRRALRIDRAAFGDDHPTVAIRLNNLAQSLKATNRLAEAEPLMREGLRIERAAKGNDHPNVAIQLNNLAQLLQATNRLAEAEPLMRDALRIDRAAYGEDHPDVAIDLNNLATLLQATNRLAEAEPLMREALRIFHASLGPEHPKTMVVSRNLDAVLAAMASS